MILFESIHKAINQMSKRLMCNKILISAFICIQLFLCECEQTDRYYRPDLPEKLSCLAIIDADDTVKYITIEKSFQAEYPDDLNDSLRGFSFSISSSGGEIFSFWSDTTIKELRDYKIPDNIEFLSGEKYFLNAIEDGTSGITAEMVVPKPPPVPSFISYNLGTITLPEPVNCIGDTIDNYLTISLSFTNVSEKDQYYALLMKCKGSTNSSSYPGYLGYINFPIRESNSPGFLSIIQGLNIYNYVCQEKVIHIEKFPVLGYFIDGNKIPENKCIITLSCQFADSFSVYDAIQSIHIRLLSITESMYNFERSLQNYKRTAGDPFSEPVYLNGNIVGGNGVFAICRSKELTIDLLNTI